MKNRKKKNTKHNYFETILIWRMVPKRSFRKWIMFDYSWCVVGLGKLTSCSSDLSANLNSIFLWCFSYNESFGGLPATQYAHIYRKKREEHPQNINSEGECMGNIIWFKPGDETEVANLKTFEYGVFHAYGNRICQLFLFIALSLSP